MLVFFFSSRRRHTRCSRDWSSDVCSSDLPNTATAVFTVFPLQARNVVLSASAWYSSVPITVGSDFFALARDRKSTRLNSSHGYISYAVFCLKKKKEIQGMNTVAQSAAEIA